MKVVIDIPPDLLNRVGEVIDQGEYCDHQEFIKFALMNQLEMEESDVEMEQVISFGEAIKTENRQVQPDGIGAHKSEQSSSGQTTGPLERTNYDIVQTVDPPSEDRLSNGPLWGQYNRLFPVKLSMRRLANYLQEESSAENRHTNSSKSGKWTEADQFREETSSIAREYGIKIERIDQRHSRTRMEKLATGLPVGDNPEKSKGRFKRQFIGKVDQSGGVSGAPPRLLFANFPNSPAGMIGISEAGLKFAKLRNPLLDQGVDASQPFSEEEVEFYLNHVQTQVPDEHQAMDIVSTAIDAGIDRPDGLTDRLSTLDDSWSNTHADTVRSGLVSRMVELGLVKRERVGQRGIAYRLTDSGENYFIKNE